jgi:hypothetical protein
MEWIKDQFFGRERVLREIVAGALSTPQPAGYSLVGSKLAGKSRLLTYLASAQGPLRGEAFESWRPYAFVDGGRVIVYKVDCDWQDAQRDLLGYIADRLTHHLQTVERIQLDWAAVENQPGASRRLWQISRQLNQLDYRLVLLLDNFDAVFENQLITADSVDELRPLTRTTALVVATEQPLHDLDRELAASPLFNVMTQLFIGLLEADAASRWLAAYDADFPGVAALTQPLLHLTGAHPFLLLRMQDILAEVQLVLPPGQRLDLDHLPVIRLRLAEHGRLLFVTNWRKLQAPPRRIDATVLMGLVERMLEQSLPLDQVARDHISTLNWLINQAMVVFSEQGYRLFSPLFAEFLAHRLAASQPETTPSATTPSATTPSATTPSATVPLPRSPAPYDAPIYDQLTKTESALLRYFQSRAYEIVTPEQLLADVWKRPHASSRRVQEAIRRLRLELEAAQPPVGLIENERGQGYRFVPTP